MDIKSIVNPNKSNDHPRIFEKLDAIHKQIKFQFQIPVDQYKLTQAENTKTLEKKY